MQIETTQAETTNPLLEEVENKIQDEDGNRIIYRCMVCGEKDQHITKGFYLPDTRKSTYIYNAHKTCVATPTMAGKKEVWTLISGLFKSHDWREDMKLVNAPAGWWNPVPIEDVTDENGYWTAWSVLDELARKAKNARITVNHKERSAADLPHYLKGISLTKEEWVSIYELYDNEAGIEGIDPSHMARLFQTFDFLALHGLDWGWLKIQKLVETATGHKPAQQTIEAMKVLWLALERERMSIKDEELIWWADERIKHLEDIKERAHPRLQRRLEVQIQMLREQKAKDQAHYQVHKQLDAITDEWKREKFRMLQNAANAEKRTAKNAERAMKARINRKKEKYDVANHC